jgi:hypothetical protein
MLQNLRRRWSRGGEEDAVGGFGVAIVDCSSSSYRSDVPCRYLACIGGVPLLVVDSSSSSDRVEDGDFGVLAKQVLSGSRLRVAPSRSPDWTSRYAHFRDVAAQAT